MLKDQDYLVIPQRTNHFLVNQVNKVNLAIIIQKAISEIWIALKSD